MAASTPFRYFTDHAPELGRAITEGRRREFATFRAFTDPAQRRRIPDPQAAATFFASKLEWSERRRPPHDQVLALYRRLLHLRRNDPVLRCGAREGLRAQAVGEVLLVERRHRMEATH